MFKDEWTEMNVFILYFKFNRDGQKGTKQKRLCEVPKHCLIHKFIMNG